MQANNIGWNFDNSYLALPDLFFSKIEPNIVSLPQLEVFNDTLGRDLGLHIEKLKSEIGIPILAGNQWPEGGASIAQAYAGHQFGYFTMLGDGRAVLIGEQITPQGERVDIQLKGSGKTPYSRRGDGRGALGPMLREYLISESMHSLGIPTTRSLGVVTTGDPVFRESTLPGAVLIRVASSHIRVGTFQYAAHFTTLEDVKSLADYTIWRHFPDLKDADQPYLALLKEVIKCQASLIAKWQLVGFIHGVMNTDNMLISGETIDYGPCAFMDTYDPDTVFSSIDRDGRYAHKNQPHIGAWNLARFAETLLPLIHLDEGRAVKIAQMALQEFPSLYNDYWLEGMRLKLGILTQEDEDITLIKKLLSLMKKYKADFTNTFFGLTKEHDDTLEVSELFQSSEFKDWHDQWRARLGRQNPALGIPKEMMKKHNPVIIPRNHLVEDALELAVSQGDYTLFNELLMALSTPYNDDVIKEQYAKAPQASKTPYRTFCGT